MNLTVKKYKFAVILIALCGLAVYGHFRLRPADVPPAKTETRKADKPAAKTAVAKATPSSGSLDITQAVIASGGDTSTGGTLSLTATIGQPVTATSSGGSFVLSSGFFSSAITDLTVTKTNDVSGNTSVGTTWNWTLHVADAGDVATFGDGTTVLTDNLPNTNIAYGAVAVLNVSGITGSISCNIDTSDLNCVAVGTVSIAAGGSFDVRFSATASAAGTFANPRSGGSCSVDPNNVVDEADETNNTCSDSVNVTSVNVVYTDPAGVCGGNAPCFTSIQAAIDSLTSGGTVNVGAGTYNESVNVDQPVVVNIQGDITVNSFGFPQGTINGGTATISDLGAWSSAGGTFNAESGTVNFNGTGTQTISGNSIFNNLTINNPAGVQLNANQTVTSVLTLTNGLLITNGNTLVMANSATVNRTSSDPTTAYVLGTITKQAISGSFSFPVGDSTGFTPLDTANASGGGDFTVTAASGHGSGLDPNHSLAQVWTLVATGSVTLDMTFNYQPGDVNGDESQYRIIRIESGTAVTFGTSVPGVSYDPADHKATIMGVSQFSVWTLGESVTPTAVNFDSATITTVGNGHLIEWKTGFEINNLGFNIYREVGGQRVKINQSLIAGSALMVGGGVKVEAGNGYSCLDDSADSSASYWIEDVDLDGASTWHGPYGVSASNASTSSRANSMLLADLNSASHQTASIQNAYPAGLNANSATYGSMTSQTNGRSPMKPAPIPASMLKQWSIASQPAIKIAISKSGWYQINMLDLYAAGLSTSANPDHLQMFVGGVEVPIKLTSSQTGTTVNNFVEFYATGLDTPSSNTQIYWLTAGSQIGKRIGISQSPGSSSSDGASSFQYTVERKDRSLYFSSLLNGDAENWFGPVISTTAASQSLTLDHLDKNSSDQAMVEIALQGVTTSSHQINVTLNGSPIENITFDGMTHKTVQLSIPQSSLIEGNNQITLTAQNSGDVSLVDYVRITYAHSYTANNNNLFASVAGNQAIQVTGFTSNQIRAIDVFNPSLPVEVEGTIGGDAGNYSISFAPAKQRNLLVFTPDQMLQPLSITANQPSTLNKGSAANFVIITYKDFMPSIQPFVAFKQSQGYQVAVVDVEDIYDEFSYGVHSPYAVKDFLDWTYLHWQKQPQYVMLAGSGSLDPKNYAGLGQTDLVPVKLIDTSSMETASDDWFVDFNNDGRPQMSIGRLPVRNAADATDLVNKIIGYEQTGKADSAVLVSDVSDNADFNTPSSQIKALLPPQMNTVTIVRGQTNTDARTELIDQLSQGGKIINYEGHGSVNLWRGNLLTSTDAALFANQKASPLLVTMTCLNGYFMDPRAASLGESLIRVHQGGAVTVWASSGMTDTGNQSVMNQEFFRQLFGTANITIGQAIKAAKSAETDNDVRRTWILFGDPTMQISRQ